MNISQTTWFIFGLGFSGMELARELISMGAKVSGTTQNDITTAQARALGIKVIHWPHGTPCPDDACENALNSSHIVTTIAPKHGEDLIYARLQDALAPKWLAYVSTTGVYGDHQGAHIDETAKPKATTKRGIDRIKCEDRWLGLGANIFRCAGIYGPGRNAILSILSGKARRIIKPGHKFGRIHIADIANAIIHSTKTTRQIFNCADDLPTPPDVPLLYAAQLCNIAPIAPIAFDKADLSAMAASFYADRRTINNAKLRELIGGALRYPTYREGLRHCLDAHIKNRRVAL